MIVRSIFAVILSLFILSGLSVNTQAQATNAVSPSEPPKQSPAIADLDNLIGRINAQFTAGPVTKSNLQTNLTEFDQLLAKHKDASEADRAQIMFMKVKLYLEVLHDTVATVDALKEYQRLFPNQPINGDTGKFIASLEPEAAAQKIRDSLAVGTRFPDFSVTDLSGKPLSLATLKGKVVLIDFWATWCPMCVASLPDLAKAYSQYRSKGFEVVGINQDRDVNIMKRFLKSRDIDWPQYADAENGGQLAARYGAYLLPTTFLIDGDGKIIGKNLLGDELEKAIKQALGITANETKDEPAKPKS